MKQASAPNAIDDDDADLNRAIDELRGVLRDDMSMGEDGEFALPQDADSGLAAGSGFYDGDEAAVDDGPVDSGLIMNIPVDVQIILGSAEMQVADLMTLRKGATVALNRRIGEPVDVVVNGRRIARGEITVLENDPSRFGIKLTEIIGGSRAG